MEWRIRDKSVVIFVGIAVFLSLQSGCSSGSSVGDRSLSDEVSTPSRPAEFVKEAAEVPRRIILFIGDGMGLNAVAASGYAAGEPLAMMEMPYFGMVTTHEYEFVTTDSAAGATAIATGYKTHFEGISVKPGTEEDEEEDPAYHLPTLIDAAKEAGMRTGLVSTTRINHATPGAFAAHRRHRGQYEDIALDMSRYGVDVLLGGGARFFEDREDGRALFEEMSKEGYEIARSRDETLAAPLDTEQLIGLSHPSDMPFLDDGDRTLELEEMVVRAIELLDRPEEEQGFFLMVEGSLIDWGGHEMNAGRVISETLDMDRALRRALEYAQGREDTLVVVTADHETGGLDLLDEPRSDAYLKFLGGLDGVSRLTIPADIEEEKRASTSLPVMKFPVESAKSFGPQEGEPSSLVTSFGYISAASRVFWDGKRRFSAAHTPEMVPVFAFGPGGKRITSMRDNTDLGRQLWAWMAGEEYRPEVEGWVEPGGRDERAPKNTILILTEGMGLGALSGAYYHFGDLSMLRMGERAYMATHSVEALVGDGASAATAISTGRRTRRGALGMAPVKAGGELEALPSLLTLAGRSGKKTGLISDGALNEPSVAAFFSHKESAEEFSVESALEELLAMGDRAGRVFGLDLLAIGEDQGRVLAESQDLVAQGYSMGRDNKETPLIWLQPEAGTGENREFLDMVEEGLEILSGGEEGFLMVLQVGGPAKKMVALERGEELLEEIYKLDQAVERALSFAEEEGQTLVLVTSAQDHPLSVLDNHYGFHSKRCGILRECGGDFEMSWHSVATDKIYRGEGLEDRELQGEFGPPRIGFQYTWLYQAAEVAGYEGGGGRAANFVPLFAHGPGAQAFDGLWEQPRLGQWLKDWAASEPGRQP